MTAEEFKTIQRAAGLSDRQLSERLGYGLGGVRKVRRFKRGQMDIPATAADAMRAIQAEGPKSSH